MGSLQEISDGLVAAVEAAGPGPVEVRARRGKSATGIVWDKDHVLTSSHSIENDEEITVAHGDKEAKATVVGRDPGSAVALLRGEGRGASPAERGSGADLKPGQ